MASKSTQKIVNLCNPAMHKGELKLALDAMKGKKVKVVVEIGVHHGESLEVWRKFFNPEILIGIEPYEEGLNLKLIDKIGATIINGVSESDWTHNCLKTELKGRKVDFLFIDGNHSYYAVKNDFEFYQEYLAERAIVGFHDISLRGEHYVKNNIEVYRAWNEIKKGRKYQEFMLVEENATGIGLLFL